MSDQQRRSGPGNSRKFNLKKQKVPNSSPRLDISVEVGHLTKKKLKNALSYKIYFPDSI